MIDFVFISNNNPLTTNAEIENYLKNKTMTSKEAAEYFEYIVRNVKNSYIIHINPIIISGILCSKGWSMSDVLSVYRIRDRLIKLSIQNNFDGFRIYLEELRDIVNKNKKEA